MHGGNAAIGRANGAFRTGRYTKKAIEEREQAKLLVMEAQQDARDGFPELAKRKIREATALEMAWLDRYERIGPKPGRRPKHGKRPLFPNGYTNIAHPENRGRYTKPAKAADAELRMLFARATAAAKRPRVRPRKRKPGTGSVPENP
jgi:hypothetical protein